jgi:serine protease AprX
MHHCGPMKIERGSALWGKGSRGALLVLALLAIVAAFAASARADSGRTAWVPSYLVTQAQTNPDQLFNVIVQGQPGDNSGSVAAIFTSNKTDGTPGKLKAQFQSINGVAGSVTGKDLLKLAQSQHVASIVPDVSESSQDYLSQLVWQQTVNLLPTLGWGLSPAPKAPTIAIVDSGVDRSKLQDFGARVVASVDFSGTAQNADDEGHGTMVAGLAAGAGLYGGVARNANLVSLRTSDRTGASRMSDVILACDWILQNKDKYGIRVANFSMRSSVPSSFRYDPLDKAVEALWFRGVVVVAAVGNYGVNGQPTKIQYSPGNDPFVISVGALDTNGTAQAIDDKPASWSAYGHTLDGFAKPDLSAPGRWMVAPVPMGSYLATSAPDRVVAPGYMWMSGTSLAAPVVSGAAAAVLAVHPTWTPDQVKGALMRTAQRLASDSAHAGGVGEVNVGKAAALTTAPNPNTNLDRFLTTDANGRTAFDGTTWMYSLKGATDWSATDWSSTDWSATDWSATDWSATDWSATDWSATDWSATDWSATDWSATDWSATDWSQ